MVKLCTRSSPLLLVLMTKTVSPSCTDKTAVKSLPFYYKTRTFSRLFHCHKIPLVRAFCAFSQTQMNDFPFPHPFVPGDSLYERSGDARPLRLMGVNFVFWSRLGCSGQTPLYLAKKVSFRVKLEEMLKNYIFSIRFIYAIHVIKI